LKAASAAAASEGAVPVEAVARDDAATVGQLRRELEQAKHAAEAAERAEMELHVQLEGLEREKAEVRLV
jgi:hypothetical protein